MVTLLLLVVIAFRRCTFHRDGARVPDPTTLIKWLYCRLSLKLLRNYTEGMASTKVNNANGLPKKAFLSANSVNGSICWDQDSFLKAKNLVLGLAEGPAFCGSTTLTGGPSAVYDARV